MTVAPLALRYLVVCPWQPAGRVAASVRGSRRALRVKAAVHERAIRDSLRHSEGVRADLEAMGLPARPLTGAEVLDLLHGRFDPDAQRCGRAAGELHVAARSSRPSARRRARRRRAAARRRSPRRSAPRRLTSSERSHIQIGESLEEVFYVSLAPEQTWLGWLLHMMQAPRPFTLSVHVQATERYRERMAQKRRYKRLYGVNRGVEQRGRPLDPDARVQEEEAAELNDELATSAGAGIYRVSIYCSLQEPGRTRTPRRLHELCQATAREVTMACDARIQHGLFAQASAVAVDAAARPRRRRAPAQVRQPQRRRHLPAVRDQLREPRRHPARVRAARPHAGAPGPVRPGAPEPSAADQRHVGRGQDDGRDHPA